MVRIGRVTEALGLLDEMEERGVERDSVTYSSMINALLSIGEVDEALELFEESKEHFGAQRDIFATVVVGLCKLEDIHYVIKAEELLKGMVRMKEGGKKWKLGERDF